MIYAYIARFAAFNTLLQTNQICHAPRKYSYINQIEDPPERDRGLRFFTFTSFGRQIISVSIQ